MNSKQRRKARRAGKLPVKAEQAYEESIYVPFYEALHRVSSVAEALAAAGIEPLKHPGFLRG